MQNYANIGYDLNLNLRGIEPVINRDCLSKNQIYLHGATTSRNLLKNYLTKEILQECMQTLDIFKEIMEDELLKIKTMKDVYRNINLSLYDSEAIIYNKGDIAQQIYFVISGSISLCMPVAKQIENATNQQKIDAEVQYEYQEIDYFEKGIGFGQAEFISSKKRGLVAFVKSDKTVIGKIGAHSFEEIIENYRQRVYYKKIDMFSKCPLLKMLQPYQLEFVVNNAKPIIFTISKTLVKQGEKPKALYLLTKGHVQLVKVHKKQNHRKMFSSKNKVKYATLEEEDRFKIKNMVIGILQEGQFVGASELALQQTYDYSAICKTEKVHAYSCDERIILSQMNEQIKRLVTTYYKDKKEYYQTKEDVYEQVKNKIQKHFEEHKAVILNPYQTEIKRKIRSRYIEKIPSLIGHCSPRQIQKMVDRKYARLKTSPTKENLIFPPISFHYAKVNSLKRSERSLSPIISHKKLLPNPQKIEKLERSITEVSQDIHGFTPYLHSNSCKVDYLQKSSQINQFQFVRSETKPLLVFMRPFQKKVQSLHERLSKNYNSQKLKEKVRTKRKIENAEDHHLSALNLKRVHEIISKIKKTTQFN